MNECPLCYNGELVVNGSPFENEAGEDDAQYLVCNKCEAVFNEKGHILYEGKER